MTTIIESAKTMGYNDIANTGFSHWFNPVDKLVYAGIGAPMYGFDKSDNYFFPVFDPIQRRNNISKVREAVLNSELTQGFLDSLPSPYIAQDYETQYEEWLAQYQAGGRERLAALVSPTNQVTNILNVYTKVYGLTDREYAGKFLAQSIPVDKLVIDIDTALKFGGISKISELGLPKGKELTYTRTHFEAEKYGLVFEISYDSILKNIHNPVQDSIQVAGTKIAQRHSYDIISLIESSVSGTAALAAWDTYVSGTERSTQNPVLDIQRIVTQSIEGTSEGGKFNTLGWHPVTKAATWDQNSYTKGVVAPVGNAEYKPGTGPLPKFEGVTWVQDQFIPQGTVYLLDQGFETAVALFEGPQYVASKQDEFTKATRYGIFEYHTQGVINPTKIVRVTGASTPLAPP